MSNVARQRLDYIDATKGVAILCITFLHFEKGVIPDWLNTWIGLFMITTFYLTSGWVSGISNKQIKPNELLKKRIKQLGVPYLWFSAIIVVFDIIWIALGYMESNILLRDIYKTITLRGIGTLWFLPVLVIGEYIFAIVRNRKQKWGHKLIGAGRIKLLATSATLFAISIALVVNPPFDIYYINGALCNTLPAIAFMCLFALFPKNVITGFFTYWGVNSLILMCTHFSITMEILMAFDKHVLHHPVFEGPVTILYFVACILLTYPLVHLFNDKLKFMIGK